jgi:RimJ/RimL family protein N-acetyltransferase
MERHGALARPPMQEKIELNTPRLLLRAAINEDAEAMHKAFSDPEVMRYW